MDLQLPLLHPRNGRFPGFKRTLSALGDMPAFLYRALEFGTAQNRTFFEKILSEKERPRPHIREIIVRDQAKRFLERNDFQVEDEAVMLGNEPLSALVIRCGPVQLRVLKGVGGLVPGCGDSTRRRDFYGQCPDVYRDRKGETRTTKLNLLVLWDFDKAFNLSSLWLVCPLRGGEKPHEVLWHWHEPIPHPAATIATSSKSLDDSRQQAEEDLEKLLRDQEPEEPGATGSA